MSVDAIEVIDLAKRFRIDRMHRHFLGAKVVKSMHRGFSRHEG